eukprot:SAG31_NODE_4402_length_3267_cov_1.552715_4_plen_117_part_00
MQGRALGAAQYAAWYVWDSLEFVGEVAADFLGLNDSQYQYIVDEYKRREEKRLNKLRRLRALRAARESKELDEMEGGDADLGYIDSESEDSESEGETASTEVAERTPLIMQDATKV